MSSFSQSVALFQCPICHMSLHLSGTSFLCPQRHTFDMAKQGYVNLLLNAKKDPHYDKNSFIQRSRILEAGFYSHILEALKEELDSNHRLTILDVACGEGYYARALSEIPSYQLLAFDLSKDSVLLAAKKDPQKRVSWFVGDLAKLPLADDSVDVILDIFSPANYQEFLRVLKPGGKLIKMVTASDHLQELREAAAAQLQSKTYSNQAIVDHFAEAFPDFNMTHLSQTYPIEDKALAHFVQMTPLFFNVNTKAIPLASIHKITVAADMLVAQKN